MFKVRHEKKGRHMHCTIFHRTRDGLTWQNCGSFVIDAVDFEALKVSFAGAEFVRMEVDNDFRV